MITAGDIKIQSRYTVNRLLDMELDIREGHHGKLVLRGSLSDDSGLVQSSGDDIRITAREGEDGGETILFHGIIREAHLFSENGVKQVILSAETHDTVMDRQRNSKSFQDVSLTYDGIMRRIVSGYHGEVICECPSVQTGIPVVQYEETDWEFCLRMAGGMGYGIFCDETAERPVVRIGLPEGGRRAELPSNAYKCRVDEDYYHGPREDGLSKTEFLYYEVLSEENHAIGDYTGSGERKRYIFAKRAELRNGVLTFCYKMGGKSRFLRRAQYNQRVAGVSLPGRVVATEGESVFLKLDIDGEEGRAVYPYPWRPVTGNLLYGMPRTGTRAYLYFPDRHEERAMAVNSIRTNGGAPCFGDLGNREFVTEHGKCLLMHTDEIRLVGGMEGGEQFFSLGEAACLLKSGGMIRMTGGGGILLCAPEISVSTPLEINHLKSRDHALMCGSRMGAKGSRNPATGGDASLSMQYEFNGLAAQGVLRGTAYEKYKAFDDAPDYEGDYPIGVKIAAGVAVALLVGAAVGAAVFLLAPASMLAAVIGLSAMQLAVCAGAITAVAGAAAAVGTAVRDDGDTPIGKYIDNSLKASLQIGGAIVQAFLIPRGTELLAYTATGGLPVPFMGRVIMPEQIFALSQIAGWGLNIKNLGFQFLDLAMFLISGKELGADTGIALFDKERNLTEFLADLLSYYGLWNPYTYQEPTVVPAPDGATAGMEGSTDLTVPDVPTGNSGGIMIPIPEQAGNGTVPEPPQVDVDNGLGGQGQGEGGTDVINKLDDVLSSKTLTNQTKKVDNYVSSIKGNAAAKADFDAMNPTNIRTYANGTIAGDLPDGRTINIHPSTTLGGTPSVEIYDPVTGKSIKIRY